jgi:hypothetical protein
MKIIFLPQRTEKVPLQHPEDLFRFDYDYIATWVDEFAAEEMSI